MYRSGICSEEGGREEIEKDRAMFMVFIDLEKVYDNVCRKKLWRVLFDYGIRGRMLRSVKAL